MLITIIFLLFILITVLIYNIRGSILSEPPFISTRKAAIPYIINALKLKNGDLLFDIGSGDGEVLSHAIRSVNGVKGIGVDVNPIAYIISCINTRNLPIKIYYDSIFNKSLSSATHIYCYLLPEFLEKIEYKVVNECKNVRIVTCDFCFPNLIPIYEKTLPKSQFGCQKIFVYQLD